MYSIKKGILMGLLSVTSLLGYSQFSENAQWIGAISHENAKLPRNVVFSSYVFKTDNYRSIWANVDTLAKRSIQLRHEFKIEKPIAKANITICGLGHYEAYLNGQNINDAIFSPLWSDYAKTVYYNQFDITRSISKGENVLAVLLGNGMYNEQGGRYYKYKVSYGAPTLLLTLKIEYLDGSSEIINSTKDWKYLPSPITFNSMFGGEDYDARLESDNWNKTGFNDENWRKVVVQTPPKGELRLQTAPAVKIMERYTPTSVVKLNLAQIDSANKVSKRIVHPHSYVFDMGQNLAGFPAITVNGQKGDTVTLIVAESLTKDGAATQQQSGRHHIYSYVLKGEGDESWHPRFSYYGFRYIQVEGVNFKGESSKLPELKKVESCFVYNSAPQTGFFECSNELFNQTHQLILQAMKSNMQAVFTDCPQREKLGWLEQIHLNGPGLMYNFDLKELMPKVMQDMVDAQLPDGMVPSIAPMYTHFGPDSTYDDFGTSPEWGSALLIMPKMYQSFYDNSDLLKKHYPQMKAYFEYLKSKAVDNILDFGLGDWYDYGGDFKAGFAVNTPRALVATAHYYYDATLLVELADKLGYSKDKEYFATMAREIAKSFNAKFFNSQRKKYATGSQTSMAIPLFFGLVKDQDRAAVMHNLLSNIYKKGNKLTTGDVGNRYLFRVLADNDWNDLMFKMHNHYEVPGYGFQLKSGATTLTEQWDPKYGSSMNHFMLGQIEEWFYRSLAGIQPSEDGYKNFVIEPEVVGDLQFVKAETGSVYGKISVNWTRKENDFQLKVTVPQGTTAKVILPDGRIHKIKAGNHSFKSKLK